MPSQLEHTPHAPCKRPTHFAHRHRRVERVRTERVCGRSVRHRDTHETTREKPSQWRIVSFKTGWVPGRKVVGEPATKHVCYGQLIGVSGMLPACRAYQATLCRIAWI